MGLEPILSNLGGWYLIHSVISLFSSGAQESNRGLTAPIALNYRLLQVFLARIHLKCRATVTLTPEIWGRNCVYYLRPQMNMNDNDANIQTIFEISKFT